MKNFKRRFEYFKDKKLLIDGAHNPNGINVLRKNLDIYFKNQNFRFIFGCLKNKNYPEMIENLFTENNEIYFNEFNHPNSATYEELSSKYNELGSINKTAKHFHMAKRTVKKMLEIKQN